MYKLISKDEKCTGHHLSETVYGSTHAGQLGQLVRGLIDTTLHASIHCLRWTLHCSFHSGLSCVAYLAVPFSDSLQSLFALFCCLPSHPLGYSQIRKIPKFLSANNSYSGNSGYEPEHLCDMCKLYTPSIASYSSLICSTLAVFQSRRSVVQ